MTTMIKLDRTKLKDHANANINRILDILGITYRRSGDLIQASCPCKQHPGDGDNPTAFSWRDSVGHWVCWTHHCEQELGADVFGLIRSVVGCGFNDSLDWVATFLSNHKINIDEQPKTKYKNSGPSLRIHEPLNESLIRYLQPNYDYLLGRGYKLETLKKFEIGFWNRLGTFMHNRQIFPIRDIRGSLVGFSGRTIYPEADWGKYQIKAKWVHGRYYDRWPKLDELKTGSLLFNLDKAKDHIGLQKTLILVEGPLDGLRLDEAGFYNWVALLGCNFGASHRSLLVSLGINNLVMALDIDKAGTNATSKIERSLSEFFHIHKPVMQNDPGKTSIEDLKKIFNAY